MEAWDEGLAIWGLGYAPATMFMKKLLLLDFSI